MKFTEKSELYNSDIKMDVYKIYFDIKQKNLFFVLQINKLGTL